MAFDQTIALLIYAVRQVQEKCIEHHMDFTAIFINHIKAFDPVNRETCWAILANLRCPRKFVNITRLSHEGMMGLVITGDGTSTPSNISIV